MIRLLDNDDLQAMVDYSFGDQSGVLGGIPQAYMKKANYKNYEFMAFMQMTEKKTITLFIDNIRLYRRRLQFSDWMHKRLISHEDKHWLSQFEDEDLLNLCCHFPNHKFIIFTAFEDTPLDEYIKVPDNVTIWAANSVVFNDKIHPFPHGLERKMYEGYDHQEILKDYMENPLMGFRFESWKEPNRKLLFVAHREDTGDRKSIGQLFKDKEWATVTYLPYREYLRGIADHKFVLCPSGNGIESARNWETLYMKRVPVFKDHPYLREMFKDFPALFVKEFDEVTEELLIVNDHLYQQAQNMDMNKLDLDYWFQKATQ